MLWYDNGDYDGGNGDVNDDCDDGDNVVDGDGDVIYDMIWYDDDDCDDGDFLVVLVSNGGFVCLLMKAVKYFPFTFSLISLWNYWWIATNCWYVTWQYFCRAIHQILCCVKIITIALSIFIFRLGANNRLHRSGSRNIEYIFIFIYSRLVSH